jgi:DNA polymerase elongation subunit (family B)
MQIKIKTIVIDIETIPFIGYSHKFYDAKILKILNYNSIVSFSYKIIDGNKIEKTKCITCKEYKSYKNFIEDIHKILSSADCIVGYYSSRFDIPFIQREFAKFNLDPIDFVSYDLHRKVKKLFYFPSYSLENVCRYFGIGEKGINLSLDQYLECLDNPKSYLWKRIIKYNKQDVDITTRLYFLVRKWSTGHINLGIKSQRPTCSRCGSIDVIRRGYRYTAMNIYNRYQCKTCGGYFKGSVVKEQK